MRVVDISQFENTLVIHFATNDNTINAYTLASALVGFADAAKAANSVINVGHEIEIVVEALGPGSFRAKIRAVYSTARNLFSNQVLQTIMLGIVSAFIYERTLAVRHDVKIEVHTNEVVIQSGDDRVIVPRAVYDATRRVEQNQQFIGSVGRALDTIERDPRVTGFALVPDLQSPPPEIIIPREALPAIATNIEDTLPTRTIDEQCDLQIV